MTGTQITGCFDQTGVPYSTNSDDLDLVSENAGDTGIVLESENQKVQIAVERTGDDAHNTKAQYDLLANAFDVKPNIEQHGNVVVAFSKSPTSRERQLVEQCVP